MGLIKSIENEGIVFSRFDVEPGNPVTFGVTEIRNKQNLNLVSDLKVLRVVTEGTAVFKSGPFKVTQTKETQPMLQGSPYYTIVESELGCKGAFLGFNDPHATIVSIERKLFKTECSVSSEYNCVLVSLNGPIIIDGKSVDIDTPVKVAKGSVLTIGLGETDLIAINYE